MAKYYQDQQNGYISLSGRRIRRNEPIRYIIEPRYGGLFHSNVKGGRGTLMWTVLGPDGLTGGGVFGNIMARMGFDTNYWIAGHMLNGDFGGYGEARNLVPLTGEANRNHATYEGWVKNAVHWAQRMDDYDSDYFYGVFYRVTASAETFFNGPFSAANAYCMAPSYITVEAQLVKVAKNAMLTGRPVIYRLSTAEEGILAFSFFRVEIHNTEAGAGIVATPVNCVVPRRAVRAYPLFVPGEH